MICINNLSVLLICFTFTIYCHDDEEKIPKLILISIVNFTKDNFIKIPPINFISLLLNHSSNNLTNDFDSILNGCYKSKLICEPIWVKNQRHLHDSVIMNWPNQLVFNNTIWPTFSFGDEATSVSLNLRLERMLNWMNRQHTTLGIMSINLNKTYISNDEFIKIFKSLLDKEINIIFLTINSSVYGSRFFAMGPRFNDNVTGVSSINMVDIYSIIDNVIKLNNEKSKNDGNKTLALLLIKESHHHKINWFELLFISVVIGMSLVISCIVIVGAVKNTNGKKINHQYNLGMNQTTDSVSFPENAYLLNASDDDELFTDALPHTSRSP